MKTRSALLALPALLVLGACGSTPTYDGVEPAEFAAAACSGWAAWHDVEEGSAGAFDELTGSGEEQKAQLTEVAEGMVAALQQARDDVAAAQPAVEDGAEIVGFFTTYYDARLELGNARIAELADFPTDLGPNEDNIVIEGIDVIEDLSEHGQGQPQEFPFSQIDDQDVVGAIDEEPSCADIVTVR